MTSKKIALRSLSGAAFNGVKWSLSVVASVAASLFVILLEAQS